MSSGSETRRHRIGIIAGSGPEAGIDMWSKILQEHRAFLGDAYRGDIDAPEVMIVSLPELGHSMDLENEQERVWTALAGAATRLSAHVDAYVIACNTLNFFSPRLEELHLPAELLTPASAAAAELRRRNADSVALLGSRQTMDLESWSSYSGLRDNLDVEIPRDQDRVHELIQQIKRAGGSTPAIEREFAEIRATLDSEIVLLACTEFPLLQGVSAQESSGAIDVSRLLAREVVRWQRHPRQISTSGGVQTAILYTGGTFGMTETPNGLAPAPQLKDDLSRLIREVSPQIADSWTYDQTPAVLDSSEATYPVLAVLADAIRLTIETRTPDSIVVIHGTDSMAYSAAYVAFALADLETPIIFTGSQLPLGAPLSDAPANFEHAVSTASELRSAGVRIVFGGRVLPAVRARKRSTVSAEGFVASQPVGRDPEGVSEALARSLAAARDQPQPEVTLLKITPGITQRQLAAALAEPAVGVVLECYGSGTAPVRAAALASSLSEATDAGTSVIAVTQCEHGGVELGRYAVGDELARSGVQSGGDMTCEAALGKLSALSRAGYVGAELHALMATNLIGEIELSR